MKLEIFTLCDYAADYGGKVCITGAFDRIRAKTAPHVVRNCTVFARVRFDVMEETTHNVRILFMDEDGQPMIPALNGHLTVRFGETGLSKSIHFMMHLQNLRLPKFGEYRVDMTIGEAQTGSLPLHLEKAPERGGQV